jgi:hypothetical protein
MRFMLLCLSLAAAAFFSTRALLLGTRHSGVVGISRTSEGHDSAPSGPATDSEVTYRGPVRSAEIPPTPDPRTPLGTSLLEDVRWTDLHRVALTDPSAAMLLDTTVNWIGRHARSCLQNAGDSKSDLAVVVHVEAARGAAVIDGRDAKVQVIEGTAVPNDVLECIVNALAVRESIALAQVPPGVRSASRRRFPEGATPSFPESFVGTAGSVMHTRCK